MTSIFDITAPAVADHLARNPMVVIPFGSVEQHGPHLPNGTDTMAARVVAEALAVRLDALVVPFGPYGVTPIHAGHPGTISLGRSTFEALLSDIGAELVAMGATTLVFVNWHEGNIASLDAVATDLQDRHPAVAVITSHACYVAQRIYEPEGGELTHGGGIETLAVLAHDPDLVSPDLPDSATRTDHAAAMDAMRRHRETHGYITDVTEIDEAGWYGNPSWATGERARSFAARVADDIAGQVRHILELRT